MPDLGLTPGDSRVNAAWSQVQEAHHGTSTGGGLLILRGGCSTQNIKESFMEEVAFQPGLRIWMSFELAGMRERAILTEETACTKSLIKLAVYKRLRT